MDCMEYTNHKKYVTGPITKEMIENVQERVAIGQAILWTEGEGNHIEKVRGKVVEKYPRFCIAKARMNGSTIKRCFLWKDLVETVIQYDKAVGLPSSVISQPPKKSTDYGSENREHGKGVQKRHTSWKGGRSKDEK